MTGEGAAGIQRDDQFSATPEEAAKVSAVALLKDLHTAMPGIVKKWNKAANTVDVQPAIKRIFVGQDNAVELPICLDVPVFFMAAGNLVVTAAPKAGDECLLVVAERAIDFWFQEGGTQVPSEYRMHDLSDCFAFVGFGNAKRSVSNVKDDAIEFRTRDGGNPVLRFEDGKISLGVESPEPIPVGDKLGDFLGKLIDAIVQITVPTGMGPSGVPINAAAITALKSEFVNWKSTRAFVQK